MKVTEFPAFYNVRHNDRFTAILATQKHRPALLRLINSAFSYQDEAKGAPRISERELQKKIDGNNFYVWLDASGVIAACCRLKVQNSSLEFGLLAVTNTYRGSSLAHSIIDAVEGYAAALGKKTLELEYMSLSPWLKRYYERYGFKETGDSDNIGWSTLIRMAKHIT